MTEQQPEPQAENRQAAPEYRKRKRSGATVIIAIAVLAVAAIVAVVALTAGRDNGEGGAPTGGDGEARGELTVGLQLEPGNLDIRNTAGVALDQILIDNVYQGLVGLAPGSVDEFVPVLAESLPVVSEDGLSYTFALREGAAFESGNPVTAADVVDSLSSEDASFTLAAALGTAPAVSSPDERTVVIELEAPNSQLLWHLANRPGLIYETAFGGDLASATNGTGPYVLEDWKQGDSIAFAANDAYWGEPATLDRVIWQYIPDANAAVNAALEGELDVVAPVTSSFVSRFDGSDAFSLTRADSTDVFTLAYNSAKEPLDDPRVRSALSNAIDGEAIIEAFYGDGKALGGPITDLEPAYEDLTAVNDYDPEGARELLAEADAEDLELTVTIPNFYPQEPIDQVVSQFAEVGVTLEVEAVEFATWLSDVYTAPEDGGPRDFDLSYVNHAEANDFVNYVTEGYYFGAVNEEALERYDAAIAATDGAEANELIREAAALVAEDAPAKWLINYTPTNAVSTEVDGFPESNTNSRIPLEGVSIG